MKGLAFLAACAVLGLLITFMLWLNDWGRTTPDDFLQMVWAFNFVVWPFLAFLKVSGMRRRKPVRRS